MLAASGLAPLSVAGRAGATGEATTQSAVQATSQAPGVSERLRDLRLDDTIEPALTFHPAQERTGSSRLGR